MLEIDKNLAKYYNWKKLPEYIIIKDNNFKEENYTWN